MEPTEYRVMWLHALALVAAALAMSGVAGKAAAHAPGGVATVATAAPR